MLFLLFDVEAILLVPWAVVYRELKLFAFFEMLIFIAVILAGFEDVAIHPATVFLEDHHRADALSGDSPVPSSRMGDAVRNPELKYSSHIGSEKLA